jgi:two-component system, chemotaxis family, CheB/CheR fusion protein
MAKKKPTGARGKRRNSPKQFPRIAGDASRKPDSPTDQSATKNRVDDSSDGDASEADPAADGAPHDGKAADERSAFTIVGVGASAGGLEAVTQLLQGMPPRPGLALVVVQHLSPEHASAMPTLLAAKTPLPVLQVTEGTLVEENHVYVVPPNVEMELRGRRLHLTPRPDDRSRFNPIDHFFESLARELQDKAVGLVLSGTASDGSAGLREIKAVGGITLAQDPKTARYDGMPQSAVNTGIVDRALPPADLARELVRIAEHPYLRHVTPRREGDELEIDDGRLTRIFQLLRTSSGVDFTHYKSPTIKRRLQRRMVLHKLTSLDQYVKLLEENPAEVDQLYQDVLIHVTRFFREPDSFAALVEHVFPNLVEDRDHERPIRIWVPGCSTGEEPYSIAIALLEHLGDRAGSVSVQIFATDVSEMAIDVARSGVYPQSITADVSEERIRRFFTKTDGHFRVAKSVRDLCVFARQDLTRDPPFSKLDMIMCRNVLIYLGTVLQRRLISIFHYALRPAGVLVLGSAETTGPLGELFGVLDKKHRLYVKRAVEMAHGPMPAFDRTAGRGDRSAQLPAEPSATGNIHQAANRLILDRYGPAAVIVDQELQIVQFRGHTGKFLEPAPGDASLNVLKMARDGLLYGLRTALHAARQRNGPVRKEGLRVKPNGHFLHVNLEVSPLAADGEKRHFLIIFEEGPPEAASEPARKTKIRRSKRAEAGEHDAEIGRLQQELAASRDYLQSIIQDLEAANEELQSANEEILSSNEELQSTNEELDTAKEELQSTNEELNTVNEELHGRNEELTRVNSDLVNLLVSVQIAIVITAVDLRIRRFTPMAEKVLNLIPGDVGRPISQIKPNINCPELEQMLHEAIENISVQQREVQDVQGRWYSLTVRPYKNVENRIDGAVLTLVDMNEMRQQEIAIREQSEFVEATFDVMHEPMLVLDGGLRVRKVNQAYYRFFEAEPRDTEGKLIYELGSGEWDLPELRQLLESVYRMDAKIDNFRLEHEFPGIGFRRLLVNARRIPVTTAEVPPKMILMALQDVTGRG